MIGLVFLTYLMVQQAPEIGENRVDPVQVDARRPGTLTDQTIARQLNALLVSDPDRVICTPRGVQQRTRLTKTRCASLREWYDLSGARAMKVLGKSSNSGIVMTVGELDAPLTPPYELVDFIKGRMRDPKIRGLAEARAGANLQAASVTRVKGTADDRR